MQIHERSPTVGTRCRLVAPAAVVTIALLGQLAHAESRPGTSGTIAVVVDQQPRVAPWFARALVQTLRRDLADYRRLELFEDEAVDSCSAIDIGCLQTVLGSSGVDVVFAARLTTDRLRYRIYDLGTGSQVAAGELPIVPGTSLFELRRRFRQALAPILEQGGLLDQKPYRSAGDRRDDSSVGPARRPAGARTAALAALAAFLLLPFAIAIAALRRRRLRRIVGLKSFALSMLLAVAAAGFAACLRSSALPAAPDSLRQILGLASGLLWGWFIVVGARVVFAPFPGLERLEHQHVLRLIVAWGFVSLQRLGLLFAYYAPFVVLLDRVLPWLEINGSDAAVAALAPALGLLLHHWFLSWVEVLGLYLDDRLVEGPATEDNPWHAPIRRYLAGYLRRSGSPDAEKMFEGVLFLPGTGDEIISYGGGWGPARIVIGSSLLEFATAAHGRPHDSVPSGGEDMVPWAELHGGLVLPEQEQVAATDVAPSAGLGTGAREAATPLGQRPTLAGVVEPSALDGRVKPRPLEDPLWLEWDPGAEDDGTEPDDLDFLFGALARELGLVRRRDSQLLTLTHSCSRQLGTGPLPLRALCALLALPYRRWLSRHRALVADAHAALHGAGHHLIQYLAWTQWRDQRLLTSASAGSRAIATEEILRRIAAEPPDRLDRHFFRATVRNRLVWLSRFTRSPILEAREARYRRLWWLAIAIATLLSLTFAIKRAIDYHPIYLDTIEEERRLIDSAEREGALKSHEGRAGHGKED